MGNRASTLKEMPKLLRAYGSEYHYLFSVVHSFVGRNGAAEDLADYMIPHIIRRLLELFLSFRIPDSRGFEEKVRDPSIIQCGIEIDKVIAITRVAHSGSHSDNVDGIARLTPILAGESLKAAKVAFEIMEKMDELHFSQMCKLCD